jgi:hypothetical protein
VAHRCCNIQVQLTSASCRGGLEAGDMRSLPSASTKIYIRCLWLDARDNMIYGLIVGSRTGMSMTRLEPTPDHVALYLKNALGKA